MGRPQGIKKLVSDKISQLERNRTSTQTQSPDSLSTVDFADSQDCSIKVCVRVCVCWSHLDSEVPVYMRGVSKGASWSHLDSEAPACLCVCVSECVCIYICMCVCCF